jgi:TolA-binding protein
MRVKVYKIIITILVLVGLAVPLYGSIEIQEPSSKEGTVIGGEMGDRSLDRLRVSFLKGDYARTIRDCESLLRRSPRKGVREEAYYLIGVSCLKEGNIEKAQETFNLILKEFPNGKFLDRVHLGIGDSWFLQGDIDKALGVYNNILEKFPDSPSLSIVLFGLGECYQKQGEWANARHCYERLTKEYPLSIEAGKVNEILKSDEFVFTVQVGSFRDKKNAERLKGALINKGYDAYIVKGYTGQTSLYRVRVGKFNTRVSAESLERQLKDEGLPTAIFP